MSIAYPLPRSTRRDDYTAVAAQTVFGPGSWLCFDTADVRVRVRAGVGLRWDTITTGFTLALSAAPAGFVTVTFAAARNAGSQVRVEGSRVHGRTTDVTRAGSLVTAALERELDKQAVVLQEVRRDLDELDAFTVDIYSARDTAVTAAGVAQGAQEATAASAAIATTKAGEAAGSATAASVALLTFGKRYLGEKASLPSTDNEGGALVEGALVSLADQPDPADDGMYVRRDGNWVEVAITITGDVPFASNAQALAGASTTTALTPSGGRAHGDARYLKLAGGETSAPVKLNGAGFALATPDAAALVTAGASGGALTMQDAAARAALYETGQRFKMAFGTAAGLVDGHEFSTTQHLIAGFESWHQGHMAGVCNVRMFGAKGDGVTDDIGAFNAAVAALPAEGGCLLIPPGRYVLSSTVSVTGRSVSIMGFGVRVSQLFFTNAAAWGLYYSGADLSHAVTITGLSVVSVGVKVGMYGIRIAYPDNLGSSWKTCTIRDVVVDGTTTVAAYSAGNDSQNGGARWGTGIGLHNVAGLVMHNVFIRASYVSRDTVGIDFTGYTVDFKIKDCIIAFHDISLRKRGVLEGFNIDGLIGLYNKQFVQIWNQDPHTSQGGVWGTIRNCHSGSTIRGIDIRGYPQSWISDNLLYRDGAEASFTHVYVDDCGNIQITGNHMTGGPGGNGQGIYVKDTYGPIITGNVIWTTVNAIETTAGTTQGIVAFNSVNGGSIGLAGSGMLGSNNLP